MDIERPNVQRRRWVRRVTFSLLVSFAIVGITAGLSRLEPAAPTVEREALYFGKVRRGLFLREVQGIGTLIPEEENWVTASSEGTIQSILLKPGTPVELDTVLFKLQNPNQDLELLQAQLALKSAQVDLQSRMAEIEDQILISKSEISELEDEYKVTQMQSSGDKEMSEKGFLPPIKLDLTRLQLESTRRKIEVKKQTLARLELSKEERLAVAHGQVEQAKAMYDFKVIQSELLQVRAGVHGVLMEFTESVGLGKHVGTGTVLAKVVDPSRLKAEIKVSERQARDLAVGLPARLEILNQNIQGSVIRINPGVIDGNVAIDVVLDEAPPHGSRPDLSISGVIEIERLEDAVFVERPAAAIGSSPGQVFKVIDNGLMAVRVPVEFGRTSAMTIEVVKGLEPGDEIIVTDMSRWDNDDKLRID